MYTDSQESIKNPKGDANEEIINALSAGPENPLESPDTIDSGGSGTGVAPVSDITGHARGDTQPVLGEVDLGQPDTGYSKTLEAEQPSDPLHMHAFPTHQTGGTSVGTGSTGMPSTSESPLEVTDGTIMDDNPQPVTGKTYPLTPPEPNDQSAESS